MWNSFSFMFVALSTIFSRSCIFIASSAKFCRYSIKSYIKIDSSYSKWIFNTFKIRAINSNIFSKIIQIEQNYYTCSNNSILAAIKCFQVQLHVKGMKEILNNVLQHNKYSHNHDVCQRMRSGIFYNLPAFSFIHSIL